MAISYDSPAVLKNFAERKHIAFPLISDSGSKIIRSFGILNETVPPGTQFVGIPYPGTYVVDPAGKIIAKHFEDDYKERTPSAEIIREMGGVAGVRHEAVTAKHVSVAPWASTKLVHPNQRVTLSLDLDLPPKMHVYAPGVQGYIAIDWKMTETPAVKLYPMQYPEAHKLNLPVIHEIVPVYSGQFRLTRDLVISPEAQVRPLLDASGDLPIEGTFRYQACDDKECYLPETVPVKWTFHFEPLDRARVPTELQRK